MSIYIDILWQSVISSVAYGDFSDVSYSDEDAIRGLLSDRFGPVFIPEFVADQFLQKYDIVDHYPNDGTGFSGTLLRDTAGNYHLAIRGSETSQIWADWVNTDIFQIIGQGYAEEQIVSMYNWYLKLTTPVDQQVAQYQRPIIDYHGNTPVYGDYEPVASSEYGEGYTISTVSGLSLGAHLSMALSRLADVQAYSFAGPGFRNEDDFFSQLGGAASFNGNKIVDVLPDAIDVFSNVLNSRDWSSSLNSFFIEAEFFWDMIDTHSNHAFMDALVVYDLLHSLGSSSDTLSQNQITELLKASAGADDRYAALETMVDKLAAVLGVSGISTAVATNVKTDLTARNTLHLNVAAIKDALTFDGEYFANLGIVSLADMGMNQVQAMAVLPDVGRGYRYALTNLLPFAVTENLTDTAADNVLYDIENFSETYLSARAQLLNFIIHRNTQDIDLEESTNPDLSDAIFIDQNSGEVLTTGAVTPLNYATNTSVRRYVFGDNEVSVMGGGSGNDYLFGMGGNDTLTGAAGSDYLEGGADTDILTGGTGDDELSGGAGNDTYRFASGDGLDRIIDATHDAGDTILINADSSPINLSSYQFNILDGVAGGFGLYQAEHTDPNAPQVTAFFNGSGLMIDVNGGSAAGGNTIVVDHFANGNFGIVLGEPEPVEAPDVEPGSYVVTSVESRLGPTTSPSPYYDVRATRPSESGINTGPIVLNADAVTWNTTTYAASTANAYWLSGAGVRYFDGGDSDDQLTGGNLSDAYDGWFGDDYIDLGDGFDVGLGGQGSDTILGGDGDDFLYGFYEPSWLEEDGSYTRSVVAGSGDDAVIENITQLPTDSDTLIGGAGDDNLIGGLYHDNLSGGVGMDRLYGGAGSDVMGGGADDDVIHGDSHLVFPPAGSAEIAFITFIATAEADFSYNDVIDGGTGNDVILGEAGDDTIYGGAGVNTLYGDRSNDPSMELYADMGLDDYVALALSAHGDDTLLGGNETDIIYGNGGNDTLQGNSGNDQLYGDDDFLAEADHGNDVLMGGAGVDHLYGQGGSDTLIGGADTDYLEGGAGDDTYVFGAGDGVDIITDNQGSNIIQLSNAPVAISYVNGQTRIVHGVDNSGEVLVATDWVVLELNNLSAFEIRGGGALFDASQIDSEYVAPETGGIFTLQDGNDTAWGSDAEDTVHGGGGNDTLNGNGGNDVLNGEGGNDTVYAGLNNDTVDGGDGDDTLFGEGGSDIIYGGLGNDQIAGDSGQGAPSSGADQLFGGEGDDTLWGYDGADTLDDDGGNGLIHENVIVANFNLYDKVDQKRLRAA